MILKSLILMTVILYLAKCTKDLEGTQKNDDDDEPIIDVFKKCYDGIGCVHTDSVWYHDKYRPVNLRPADRHIIKTEFLLIQRNYSSHCNSTDKLYYSSFAPHVVSIAAAGFNSSFELVILIHDFTSNGYTGWVKHLSLVLLSRTRLNIVSVDWQRGADPPLDQAIANARVVALEVEAFIRHLIDGFEYFLSAIHIIGHGVGAHIAGYVGMALPGIKKITGLDPTGIRFEGMPDIVKLNPKCARYVEVLHTDVEYTNRQGTKEPMGHNDFYINFANVQPGCTETMNFTDLISIKRGDLEEGEILGGCSHKRSFKYFIESSHNKECVFLGIPCNSFEDFVNGACTDCHSKTKCAEIGMKCTSTSDENNMLFLSTAGDSPYCLIPYKISVKIVDPGEYYGYFDFIFVDVDNKVANVSQHDVNHRYRDFKDTNKNVYIYYAKPPKLSKIKEAKIRWNEKKKIYCFLYCDQYITVSKVTVKVLDKENKSKASKLCPIADSRIENGAFITFKNCYEDLEIEPEPKEEKEELDKLLKE